MFDGDGRKGYQFGDVTRMLVRWLGPHSRAVRGRIDWLKFGQAIVAALVAGQVVDLGVILAMFLDAFRDPEMAAKVSAVVTAIVYLFEQGRRLFQDRTDVKPPKETETDGDASRQEGDD